ncbi:MAG: ribosome maturation factor RimP [Bdellovibrio sp.]|jgi:ribosome maturation factor RimP
MLSIELLQKLETLAGQVTIREGCELYDIEMAGVGGRRTLRVLIDKNPGGANVDDCSNVSRGLSLLLDVEDPIQGAYDLEVSTPGLDRILRKPWHYSRVVGKKIWVRTGKAFEEFGVQAAKNKPIKQATETLIAADEHGIEFILDNETVKIPFSEIEKGKLVFEFEPKGQKKGEKKTPPPKKGKK